MRNEEERVTLLLFCVIFLSKFVMFCFLLSLFNFGPSLSPVLKRAVSL